MIISNALHTEKKRIYPAIAVLLASVVDRGFCGNVAILAVSCLSILACTTYGTPALAITQAASEAKTGTHTYSVNGLKIIDNPGGGQVVYGPVIDQSTLQGAMAVMLREVHGHFGERPVIGKFFKSRDSDSFATYFTVTAKNQGDKQIRGLVIVSMPSGIRPIAAVLFDETNRFGKTESMLLKGLQEAWQKGSAENSSSSTEPPMHETAPYPLHTVTFVDNSGTIGLPTDWQITSAGAGSVHAAGQNGESVHLGVMIQNIYDPRNPQSLGIIQYMKKGRTPYFICPYGGDLVDAYMCVSQQNHQRLNLPIPTFKVISKNGVPSSQYEQQAVLVLGELDMLDGKGPMRSSIRIGSMRVGSSPSWAMTVGAVNVPINLADEEWPTMKAIVASYRENGQVIGEMGRAAVAEIHREGAAANARARAQSAANDASNAAADARRDELSRSSKVFENYQLDRTVIQDNDYSVRGTTSYENGDALVKSDPNRFQYVPNQDLLKGVDY